MNFLTSDDLGKLSGNQAQVVLRDLLWAEARRIGVPVSAVRISTRTDVPDGGIDAVVIGTTANLESELLTSQNSFYQSKAGSSFKPWQRSQLVAELFGHGKDISKDNLGSGVRRCFDTKGRYVIALFGVDPNPEQYEKARTEFIFLLKQCGYDSPDILILGQSQLIGLTAVFPSLVMSITGVNIGLLTTFSGWENDPLMQTLFVTGDAQTSFISTIRECVQDSGIGHTRIVGEPGLGKTRLALEALRQPQYAALVLYAAHAADVEGTSFFNTLLQDDAQRSAILVVDDCSPKEASALWRHVKNRTDRLHLVTLDHAVDKVSDAQMKVLECPILENKQISVIIKSYLGEGHDVERWSELCGGSPRVAHLIGENLHGNPTDLLRPPATLADIWQRYIHGVTQSTCATASEFEVVARACSLVEKFGFESPVQAEAEFLAAIAHQIEPGITWPKFQAIVRVFIARRVLQGRRTLRIVPRALHIHLWIEFWHNYGLTFSIPQMMQQMPTSLHRWFIRMFAYAHTSQNAITQVSLVLGCGGPFQDEKFLRSDVGCAFLNVLAEAHPEATLSCIERTIGQWNKEKLSTFHGRRQDVVWALEKIAIWPELFVRAVRVLHKLGAAETENWGNNASGTFAEMFSLGYGCVASSAAHPTERLPALREALTIVGKEERALALRACGAALSTHGHMKMVGPTHQGLKPTPELWLPKTYGEIWHAYKDVWDLLVEESKDWESSDRNAAYSVLIEAAHGLIQIEYLADHVLSTLEDKVSDVVMPLEAIVRLCTSWHLHHTEDYVAEQTRARLRALDARIAGSTFDTQFLRYVVFHSWDEEMEDQEEGTANVTDRIKQLAAAALKAPGKLWSVVPNLAGTVCHQLYAFGFELGLQDTAISLLSDMKGLLRIQQLPAQLYGSYLIGIKEHAHAVWESALLEAISDVTLKSVLREFLSTSRFNDRVLAHCHEYLREGKLSWSDLPDWSYSHDFQNVSPCLVEEHLKLCLQSSTEDAICAAISISDNVFCHEKATVSMPDDTIFQLLGHPHALANGRQGMSMYHWAGVLRRYVRIYPTRRIDLLTRIFHIMADWQIALRVAHSRAYEAIFEVVSSCPEEAWKSLTCVLGDISKSDWHSLQILLNHEDTKSLLITLFPFDQVLEWIKLDPASHGYFVASVCPKNFMVSGPSSITRKLMVQFGNISEIRNALHCHFWTGSFGGPASGHWRGKRETAQEWLAAETYPHIRTWLTEYIGDLNREIEKSEISEEREF